MPRAIAAFANAWSNSIRRTTAPHRGSRTTTVSPARRIATASSVTRGQSTSTPIFSSSRNARPPTPPAQILSRG